jgi:uncharacterized protein YcaQ
LREKKTLKIGSCQFAYGGFRDQADGGRPENRHLKGCLTEIVLLQIESISLGMLKNGSG